MVKYYKDELSHTFYALADANRREILRQVTKEPRSASELAKRFDLSFPAVSKHLRILEEAGFIKRDIEGRVHTFRFEPKPMKKAFNWIKFYEYFWLQSLDRLDVYLKELQTQEQKHARKRKSK